MACQEIREEFQEGASTIAILLRCFNEKCFREFHVDCAFNQGGLSLDEENGGLLTFLCDLHFKEVLFCTCKRKYDDTQAMVFCDECCDWFHTTCEGIKQRDAQKLDQQERFVCQSCRAIAKEGRTVSAALRERNMHKDFQSGCQQAAQKAVGQLIELAASVGPIVNDINAPSTYIQAEYSISDIRAALDYMNSPTFLGGEVSESNILDVMGVREYVATNSRKLADYLQRLDSWQSRAKQVCGTEASGLNPTALNKSNSTLTETLRGKVDTLLLELRTNIRYEPQDLEGFYAFPEVIAWMCDFHRVF